MKIRRDIAGVNMNKNYFLISLILIILLAGCIQEPPTTKKQDIQKLEDECLEIKLEDISKCLGAQEAAFKTGMPKVVLTTTRLPPPPSECEFFAEKTCNLTAINILVETKDFPTLAALSRNQNAPTEILTKIYQRKDISGEQKYYVKIGLGGNVHTSPSILAELGKFNVKEVYDNSAILREVAANPSTPPDTLRKLSKHRHAPVLMGLVFNHKTPEDVFIYLAQDLEEVHFPYMGEHEIHTFLAENPSVPKEVLMKFLNEKCNTFIVLNFDDNVVRIEDEILDRENDPSCSAHYQTLIFHLAINPHTSEHILNEIIDRNYTQEFTITASDYSSETTKTTAEWAQENLNNRK